ATLHNETTSGQGVTTYSNGNSDFEIFSNDTRNRIYAAEATLFGDVEAFGQKHTLFFGADYYRSTSKGFSGYAGFIPFSVYRPDYDALGSAELFRDLRNYSINPNDPRNNALLAGSYSEITGGRSLSEEYGFTGQLILRPTDAWTLIGGARWSHSAGGRNGVYCYAEEDCTLTILDMPLPKVNPSDQSAWTFQLGTTYAVTPEVNLYASYGETYTPRFNSFQFDPSDPIGTPIGPEQGEAYEIGAKGVHRGGKLSWSVALFDIARTNISQADPSRPQFQVLLGKQRSRGVEFDAQGTIVEGWEFYGSFAAMDNKFVEGEFKGYPAFFGPKLGASVYSNYEFLRGDLAGFGFGGGVVYKKLPTFRSFFGDVQGKPLPGLNPGSIVEVDASASFKLDRWKFSVQVTNLFNTKYYTPSYPSPFYAINVNPGRQAIARIGYSF
ncbi:MAG: TonB-dependent receptor, partial [Burkholderiales bacterium]